MCSKTPVVVLSPPDRSVCKDHDITLRNMKEFIDAGLLQTVGQNTLIIYSQTQGSRTQLGICAALEIEDFFDGRIKRHEATIKKADPVIGGMKSRRSKVKVNNLVIIRLLLKYVQNGVFSFVDSIKLYICEDYNVNFLGLQIHTFY